MRKIWNENITTINATYFTLYKYFKLLVSLLLFLQFFQCCPLGSSKSKRLPLPSIAFSGILAVTPSFHPETIPSKSQNNISHMSMPIYIMLVYMKSQTILGAKPEAQRCLFRISRIVSILKLTSPTFHGGLTQPIQ
ncbi:hypothetical protein CIPAW_13G021100 [Carya illinoinensis]|uniref:Uncharacterized protein n=1 Tax=Carya illinoinensis TaxID=32201 RepID=A0A8T1NF86_CARIL|nr:hypothetical protein CIPAW_13G021100 [Carya illinoinensis]